MYVYITGGRGGSCTRDKVRGCAPRYCRTHAEVFTHIHFTIYHLTSCTVSIYLLGSVGGSVCLGRDAGSGRKFRGMTLGGRQRAGWG